MIPALLLALLLGASAAAVAAGQYRDERPLIVRFAPSLVGASLATASALVLYPLVPLWARIALLAALLVSFLAVNLLLAYALLAPALVLLATLVPLPLALGAVAALILGAIALGALSVPASKKTLPWHRLAFAGARGLGWPFLASALACLGISFFI